MNKNDKVNHNYNIEGDKVFQIDRHKKIYDFIKENRKATVNELSDLCDVAAMTIRRDLDKMESDGLITRVFGGAVIGSNLVTEATYADKENDYIEEKVRIAKEAAKLVEDNSIVVLDAGTTCLEIAKELVHRQNLRVITTDIFIAAFLTKYKNIEVFCTGGRIQSAIGSCVDNHSLEFLRNINAHICFLGASAINEDFSVSTFTMEKAKVKKAIMDSAHHRVLVTDDSKFYKRSFAKVCNLSDFDLIITNDRLNEEAKEQLINEDLSLRLV